MKKLSLSLLLTLCTYGALAFCSEATAIVPYSARTSKSLKTKTCQTPSMPTRVKLTPNGQRLINALTTAPLGDPLLEQAQFTVSSSSESTLTAKHTITAMAHYALNLLPVCCFSFTEQPVLVLNSRDTKDISPSVVEKAANAVVKIAARKIIDTFSNHNARIVFLTPEQLSQTIEREQTAALNRELEKIPSELSQEEQQRYARIITPQFKDEKNPMTLNELRQRSQEEKDILISLLGFFYNIGPVSLMRQSITNLLPARTDRRDPSKKVIYITTTQDDLKPTPIIDLEAQDLYRNAIKDVSRFSENNGYRLAFTDLAQLSEGQKARLKSEIDLGLVRLVSPADGYIPTPPLALFYL